jgi:chemotaxis protein histidine kinase CheA
MTRGEGGMGDDDKPQMIQPPDHLRDKVSVTENGVDLDALEQAEQIIAGMQDSYLEWVEDDLRKLGEGYARAVESTAEDSRRQALQDLFGIAHDVKGQGGSFDYPLMTAVGNSLCRYIERLDGPIRQSHLAVVKVHIDTMRMIIAQRMSGDGGKAGDNLLRGLDAAVAKTSGKP